MPPKQSVRIDRLELHNFKSYQGKVVVGPFTSFSCIVGPNGAGKSNVMDALSFVLGTSATALRGRKPADFINRASNKSECSVTLVLRHGAATADTSAGAVPDATEMKLTRTVNAKGQITVAFNGKPIEDKEFSDVLRKLGISARTNTFLVFQHEVEAMAQRKPRELTEMIEQISGSAEYKGLYEAKRRALEAAGEALTNASVEKRGAAAEVTAMRLHRKEAERYAEVSGLLSRQRRDLALGELFHIEHSLSKERATLTALEQQARDLERTTTSEDALRKMKHEFAERHRAYLEVLKQGRHATNEAREKQQTLDRIKASIDHFQRRHDQFAAELAAARDSNAVRSVETSRLTEQLKQHQAQLEAFNKECEAEDKKASSTGTMTAQQAAQYRQLKRDADIKTITQRQELETARRKVESLSEAEKQAAIAMENQQATRREMGTAVERTKARVLDTKQRGAEAEASVKELEGRLHDAANRLQLARARRSEHGDKLREVENQLHELRFVKEDSRASAKSNDALQSLKALYKGVRGRLVDLCIPQERYRNAVTVALGKNLEAVVVDTTETALSCVRYLKEQRLVSMSFIPLNNVQGREVDDRIRTFKGTCRPVSDVIQFDVSLEPAIRYAIGQTLVCDTLEEARRVAYQSPDGQRYKVVTLEGTVLLKNGSIQGGLATIQSRARKWDEKKYDDLKAARDKILGDAAGGSEAEEARIQCEIQDLEGRLEAAKRRIQSTAGDVATIEAQGNAFAANAAKAEAAINEIQKKLDAYGKALAICNTEVDKLQAVVSSLEAEVFKDFKDVVGIEDIAELERKEVLKARIRAEKRRQFAVVIQKLTLSIEAEAKRVGVRQPEAIEEAMAKNSGELQTCLKERATYQKVVEEIHRRADEAGKKTAASKAELDKLEATIRASSRNNEAEMRQLFDVKKNITIRSATCNALRQQRVTLFERCVMNEVELPTKAPEDVGAKRSRNDGTTVAAKGRGGRHGATEEFEAEELLVSEPFMSYAGAEMAAAGPSSSSAAAAGSPRGLTRQATALQVSVCIDFSALDDAVRREMISRARFEAFRHHTESQIEQLERELDTIAPNLKATTKFGASEQKLGASTTHVEKAREAHRTALQEFFSVKELRQQRFMSTFDKLVDMVDKVYREMTLDTRGRDVHGSAYLTLEDNDEPYNSGTKYHAVPPMKRFMTIDALSGGERTIAALALLFAIHAIAPTPFFVLDEVDAALDSGNVMKLAEYLANHSDHCQYIVVSLKEQLYHKAKALVGVYKDHERGSSGILTLDLNTYAK